MPSIPKATTDFEFLFPFGWGELWGIADRTDYDLKPHQEPVRQKPWSISIRETNEKYRALLSSSRPSVWNG